MNVKTLFWLFVSLVLSYSLNAIELKTDSEYLVENETIADDYLFAGSFLEFKGETNDLFFFGEQLDFKGISKLALTAVGHSINVNGIVGNGIKAGGRTINVDGKVTGTSFLGGETVILGQESQLSGDTLIGARKLMMAGTIDGDVYIGAGETVIQNEIIGNVEAYTGQLKLTEQGKINGNLIYHSDQPISEEETARVTGTITFEPNERGPYHDNFFDNYLNGSVWLSLLFKLAFLIFGLFLLLFPVNRFLEKPYTRKEVLSHSLWGLIPIFVYPSALVIFIVLLITLPLALSMALAFVPLLFVTKVLGVTVVGNYIVNSLSLSISSRYLYFLIGVILYSLLSFIPFVGFLLLIFVSSIGCGIIVSSLFNRKLA